MKQALIVVDYQNDFVTGSLGFPGAVQLRGAIKEKIHAYRAEGGDIIFTLDTHGEDYLSTQEGKKLPVPHCIKGSEGWKLDPEIAALQQAGDLVFEKGTFGSFELAEYLRKEQYDRVELCGVVSNICVISNAALAKAALPEAEIVVDPACAASNDDSMNQKALEVMAGFQITVL